MAMKQFNFPYHTQSTEYPESGTRVQLGNSYVFTAPPSGPDMRRFRLSFPTMLYIVSDEPTATNYVKNSTFEGATPPSTIPQMLLQAVPTPGNSVALVGQGYTQDQEPYVDVRWAGTNNDGQFHFPGIFFVPENPQAPAALQNQTWYGSVGVAKVAGSLGGITENGLYLTELSELNGQVAFVSNHKSSPVLDSTVRRTSLYKTLSSPNTRFIGMSYYLTVPNGNSYDVTLRFVLPQLERDRITSPIWTRGVTVTRAQGSVSPTLRYPVNLKALEDFYNEHKMHKSFLYPHPVYGNVECKFFSPLKIPEGLPGGNGAVKDFTIELIEVP